MLVAMAVVNLSLTVVLNASRLYVFICVNMFGCFAFWTCFVSVAITVVNLFLTTGLSVCRLNVFTGL